MSDDSFAFAPPPFQPADAAAQLARELRGLGLAEREGVYERRGLRIARVSLDGGTLTLSTVRQPSRNSPQWQARALHSHADLRHALAELKRRLADWTERDD